MAKAANRLTTYEIREVHGQAGAALQGEFTPKDAGISTADSEAEVRARGEQGAPKLFGELLPELIRGDHRDAELSRFTEQRTEVVLGEVLHLIAQQGECASVFLRNDVPRHRGEL